MRQQGGIRQTPRGVQLTYPDTYYQRDPPASFIRIPGDDSRRYFPAQGQNSIHGPINVSAMHGGTFDVMQQPNTSLQPTYLEMYNVYARPYY